MSLSIHINFWFDLLPILSWEPFWIGDNEGGQAVWLPKDQGNTNLLDFWYPLGLDLIDNGKEYTTYWLNAKHVYKVFLEKHHINIPRLNRELPELME